MYCVRTNGTNGMAAISSMTYSNYKIWILCKKKNQTNFIHFFTLTNKNRLSLFGPIHTLFEQKHLLLNININQIKLKIKKSLTYWNALIHNHHQHWSALNANRQQKKQFSLYDDSLTFQINVHVWPMHPSIVHPHLINRM